MKLIEWHKNKLKQVQQKLNLSDYQIAWIAFIKGLIFGFLIKMYM